MHLIVTRTFPPEVGGMQNLMYGLAKSLSENVMIKVFADQCPNQYNFDKELSFSIERVSGPKIFKKYRKANLVNTYLENNNKVKAIIADHWKSLENINTEVKKICLIHSKEINHKKNSFINKRLIKILNNCHTVVANSNFTKNLAISVGVDENKIKVINPGVFPAYKIDDKIYKNIKKKLESRTPKLITIARFDKRKNHEKIIMALRNLKEIYPNIIYICIGQGENIDNLKKLITELKLQDQVIFPKNLTQDEKNSYLKCSDVFVMPSITYKKSVEGFGIVYVEAAQFGVPSIGGKDGGAADAIDHEQTGYICDGNSLDDVYQSIFNILENNKYKVFGKKAEEISKKFYWSKIVKKYLELL
ncbi:glycosyltransferase family 4 protein [Candidatus Pelagibacter sp.]|nr:glycosyltransferase family 4 protein [Candidatus Pelagibacter sp.]